MNAIKKIVIPIVILIASLVAGFMFQINSMEKKVETEFAKIQPIKKGSLRDGEYIGAFGAFVNTARVKVLVKGGKITSVEILEQKAAKGYEATDIPARIVEAQQPLVDAVSGATNSSKVIMIAVNAALTAK